MTAYTARLRTVVQRPFAPVWLMTALLFAVSPLIAHGSLSHSALLSMLPFAAILAIAAAGQTLVIQQRGLDLSVPGTISLAVVIVTHYPNGVGSRLPVALIIVLAAAIAVGVVNTFLIARLSMTPLVATLGMNAVLIGIALKVSGSSTTTQAARNLITFAAAKTLTVPNIALVALVLILALAFLCKQTVLGRRFQAAGANPVAARAAGIRVNGQLLGAYTGGACCYALAGVLLAGFLQAPSLMAGNSYLLPSIAAVVLGGTSLTGGRSSVIATAVGALFLTQINQVVQARGASTAVEYLIQGAIIAVGMSLRHLPAHRRPSLHRLRRRLAHMPAPADTAPPDVSVDGPPSDQSALPNGVYPDPAQATTDRHRALPPVNIERNAP